jgi:GntR family transcriptional regulator, trigonelline degradation regulator
MSDMSSLLDRKGFVRTILKSAAPLRRQVLDELRQSVISGRLEPGARLVERELVAMMGVSRTVIREALRQMESEGLISIVPNRGPIVRKLSIAEARDLYSIRAVLEGLAARCFVEIGDKEHVEKLQRNLEEVAMAYSSDSPAQILETKNRFYDALFEGAGSEALSSMISLLHLRIWRWRAMGLSHPRRNPERSIESIANLRTVLDAIRRRDADLAERTMRDEVQRASAEVLRLLADNL